MTRGLSWIMTASILSLSIPTSKMICDIPGVDNGQGSYYLISLLLFMQHEQVKTPRNPTFQKHFNSLAQTLNLKPKSDN